MTIHSDLLSAVSKQDYAQAEILLKAGGDLTAILAETGFASAVRIAVLNDDAKMIALFHTYGVNLYKPTHYFQQKPSGNALAAALKTRKTAVADALLEAGFDILHPDMDLQTRSWDFPLHAAVEFDMPLHAIRMLDALQDAQCLHDFDILNAAGKRGHHDVLAATLKRAHQLGNPFTPDELTHAARNTICENGLTMLDLLLDAGADPNLFFTIKNRKHHFTSNTTLMHFTIGSSLTDSAVNQVLTSLLKHGGDPEIKTPGEKPMNSFELAAHSGRNLPVLSKAKLLREAFLIAQIQPAIDRIYTGGDKPLPLPPRRRMP